MARVDKTPWEPGCIALSNDDIRNKNPYNGKRLSAQAVFDLLGAIGGTCWQVDSNIDLIRRQSKL